MGSKDAERARALVRERISVARAAMDACDADIEREFDVLAARGIAPTCRKGCVHCCREEILIPRAEAETIVEWIQASWLPPQLEALKGRLRDWLVWYRGDGKRRVDAGEDRKTVAYEHGPLCVALEDNACSIYPVRPMTCRMHYVSSSPDACRQASDPAYSGDGQVASLLSIHRVAQPAILRIRAVIERQGADFLGTVHLLPEWLAHLLRVEDQPWRTAPRLF
jgi:Fe-S-cluster containining protein